MQQKPPNLEGLCDNHRFALAKSANQSCRKMRRLGRLDESAPASKKDIVLCSHKQKLFQLPEKGHDSAKLLNHEGVNQR